MLQTPLKHNVKWQVSLNNGKTFFEGKGLFIEIENEPSPWQRLQKYINDRKVYITSLSLYTDDGRTFNLPSAGKNPRFREFNSDEKPLDFRAFRKYGESIDPKTREITGADLYTVAESIYSTYRLQLWVDEKDTRNCWVLSLPNES